MPGVFVSCFFILLTIVFLDELTLLYCKLLDFFGFHLQQENSGIEFFFFFPIKEPSNFYVSMCYQVQVIKPSFFLSFIYDWCKKSHT
jgi:hypothetical protein